MSRYLALDRGSPFLPYFDPGASDFLPLEAEEPFCMFLAYVLRRARSWGWGFRRRRISVVQRHFFLNGRIFRTGTLHYRKAVLHPGWPKPGKPLLA